MHLLFLFGLAIFAVGTLLMFHQYKVWREVDQNEEDKVERRFQYHLFRRRTTVASLVAIVGAMLASLSRTLDPKMFFALITALLAVLLVLLVLAGMDTVAVLVHRNHGKVGDKARKAMIDEYMRQKRKAEEAAEQQEES